MVDEKEKYPRRFGKYLLLDHLVDGGMAKLCRARTLGGQADKLVAIKMIQPQYSNDESFRTMFMDEIKVTFGLIHPNIAQTYDYGDTDGQLFTALEYVDGKNLKQYLDKLRENKFVFPVEITVYIIAQVCQGLHYAHTLTDKLSGKYANIIHRDISPHNIMLTYDGAVKVIDFGIAKASTNTDATQAGTIKGKLSYIAPEYLEGIELDPRYDEFALGITLWEMLCSQKLFQAKNDLAILKLIQACNIKAPSEINPNVPKELDEIVLKALGKDRNNRFENLDKFNRALVKFLYSNYPDFNSSDLSYFAKELFKEDIRKDKERFFNYGKLDLAPYLNDMATENARKELAGQLEGNAIKKTPEIEETLKRRVEHVIDFGFDEEKTDKREKPIDDTQRTRLKKSNNVLNNVSSSEKLRINVSKSSPSAFDSEAGEQSKGQRLNKLTKTGYEKKREGTSIKRNAYKDDSRKKSKRRFIVLFCIAILGLLLFFSGGSESTKKSNIKPKKIVLNVAQDPKVSVVVSKKKVQREIGTVRLFGYSRYKHKCFIDDKLADVTVVGDVKVDFKEHVLRIEEQNKKPFIHKFQVDQDKGYVKIRIKKMPVTYYGFLTTSRNCVEGTLFYEQFGEKRSALLPIKKNIAFPLDMDSNSNEILTTHEIVYQLKDEVLKRKTSFELRQANDMVDLCEHLITY